MDLIFKIITQLRRTRKIEIIIKMEVHHPHHVMHKKEYKEYILEFLMLFIAISLGFFAENIREHFIEKEREIKFLQNIHFDLRNDLVEIDKVILANKKKQILGDSMLNAYAEGTLLNKLPNFYVFVKAITVRKLLENSNNGFIQLKNAGGLRLIENKKVINDIQEYENLISKIEKLETISETTFQSFRFKAASILDVTTSNEMNKSQIVIINDSFSYNRYRRPENPKPLHIKDADQINELLNLASFALNTNTYILRNINNLKQKAIELDEYILKQYGNRFD